MTIRKSARQKQIEKWFFLIIAAAVLFLFWKIIEPFAIVMITAGIVAVALTPLHRYIERFFKYRKLASAITVSGTFLLIFIPLFFILLVIAMQASDLLELSFQDGSWLSTFSLTSHPWFLWLPSFVQEQILTISLQEIGFGAAQWAVDNITALFSSTARLILNTFLFFIALYYFLVDRERLYDELLVISPFNDKVDAQIIHQIVGTIRHVVFGILILAIVQGVFAGIGMTIFGVPGGVIWGAMTIIAALVPLVGSAIVLVPAVAYLFVAGQVTAAVGLAIWAAVVVGTSDNILAPFLIKGRTHMHMFLVLVSILGGIHAFGSIGFIIGPTILSAFLVVLELYKNGILKNGKWTK